MLPRIGLDERVFPSVFRSLVACSVFLGSAIFPATCAKAQCPAWFAPPETTALSFASSVAVGDFDEDGLLDLAASIPGWHGVAILRGMPSGAFQYLARVDTGGLPKSVVASDLNLDGHLDLAVGVLEGVSVLLGIGDGSFRPTTNYAGGEQGRCVVVGDFNADGRPDLAVAYSDDVFVRLGSSSITFGLFRPATTYAVPGQPYWMTAGDFDHDGILDLAVIAAGPNNLSVLRGQANGTFQPATSMPLSALATFVAQGDFNSDGNLDLAITLADHQVAVEVLLGDGHGDFQIYTDYPVLGTPATVAVGDVNGDGRLDLVVGSSDNFAPLSVFRGDLSGGFLPAVAVPSGSSFFVDLRDLNNDGLLDVIAAGPIGLVIATNRSLPRVPCDFNRDCFIDADDLGDFITCYFREPPCAGADFNGDRAVNADDLGDYITAYFAGCP